MSNNELADAIRASAQRLGVEPIHLATAMSYETGGTFDPWKKGPTTKWGEHRGLIQWGEPQRAKYGVTQDMPITAHVEAAERYLKDAGVKPGMGLLDIYSAINAGGVGLYDRSDAAAGGAPGTVRDKVETQMADHKAKAAALLGGQDITVADRSPTRPITVPEQMAAEAAPGPGIGETAMAAAREHSLTGWLVTKPWLLPDDPDFQMTDERLKALTQGIPSDRWRAFENAYSADQADSIRRELLAQMDRQRTLSEAGITGALLSVGAAIGDPIGIGVGVATAGTGNAIMWGAKLSRMQRVLSAGVAGAAVNAGLAGVEENLKPNPEWDAVLLAGAGGAFIGAGFGALSKMPHMAPEAAALRQLSKDTVEEVEGAYGAVPLRTKDSSVGASQGVDSLPLRQDANDFVRLSGDDTTPGAALGQARFDATAQAKKSVNPATRAAANVLGEDAVGHVNKAQATVWTASEEQRKLARTAETYRAQAHEPAYQAWAKEQGLTAKQRLTERGRFADLVSRAVSSTDPLEEFSPHVKKAAAADRQFYRARLEAMNDPGREWGLSGQLRPVGGAGTIPENGSYLPRIFSYGKVVEMLDAYGPAVLSKAVATAMRSKTPELAEEVADKISRGYVKKLKELAYGMNVRESGAMFSNDLEGLRKLLSDLPGVDPEDAEDVIAKMSRPVDGGSIARTKHRVLLDENLRMELPDGRVASFADLFLERDADKLFRIYNRQTSGWVALARTRVGKTVDGEQNLLIDGFTHGGEWETYIQKVRAVAAEVGQDRTALEADIRVLDYLFKNVAGIPIHDPNTMGSTISRLARDYGFLRVMGQVGFAQIAELGGIVSQAGVKAAMSGFPAFRALVRDARSGRITHELADEFEAITGLGAERLRSAGEWRIAGDAEWGTVAASSPRLEAVEKGFGLGKRITAEVSGLNGINTLLHRWTGSSILHKFSMMADGTVAQNAQRLRALGLSDEMAERVFAQIRQYRSLVDGSKTLKRVNVDQWDDIQAAAHFERAVDRMARRIVQENSPGMFMQWMSHPAAQILLQFRSFVIGAHSKQFLHNIHMWDRESVSTFLATSVTAQLGHVMQTVANAPSLSEKQLEERLSIKGIAMGGFQRTGMSALLPMVIDSAMTIAGRGGVFNSRSTGQASNVFLGNPTTGLIDDVPGAINALVEPLMEGRRRSKAEVRAMVRPLIWQNILPVTTLLGAMSRDLPDYAPKSNNR